jgi:hypothetical protein
MRYTSSDRSDKVTQAINVVYDNLPDEEKKVVTRQAKLVNINLDKFRSSGDGVHNMAQERSLVELIGKLGIWMVEHDK